MSDLAMPEDSWPQARLGPVARLRVLSAGLAGTWVEERTIDRPFDDVWGFVSDLERAAPAFDTDLASLEIVQRRNDHLRARVKLRRRFLGLSFHIDAELRPGWCWMVTAPQLYVVGMAAEAEGNTTRFAHLEGLNIPGPRILRSLARPVHTASRWRHQHHVPADVDHIEQILGIQNG